MKHFNLYGLKISVFLILLNLVLSPRLLIAQSNLLPFPQVYKQGVGTFNPPELRIVQEGLTLSLEKLLAGPSRLVMPMDILPQDTLGFLYTSLDATMHTSPEYYRLEVAPHHIYLQATTELGILHGIQTLNQLRTLEGSYPVCTIEDFPRFPYRGMHLDVCRHFFPVAFIKEYIDLLARYKFNTFHWHLTEDQGWRIEIKRYPLLTEVGAWRNGSQIGPYAKQQFDSIPYGGFYTQQEIREVVRYATERGITVMPEIEMPGHALAALAAYPELSCSGGPFEVARGWGVFEDVFCPKEATFTFLEGVLDEVMDLFPSPYIHIGGDECPKTRWKSCTHCQALIKEKGLDDEHGLQSYFIRRIEQFVNSRGRKIIGWDEILEGGLAPNAAVMSWRGTEGGIAAAKAGHYAVMTPGSHCYFDHYQGDPAFEPHAIGGYTTIQKVYSYEPVPSQLDSAEARYILGAQGNVWTEYILDSDHVEYMALPRMIALSEVLWRAEGQRNEADFLNRLEKEFPKLNAEGINFARSLYQVSLQPLPSGTPGSIKVVARPSISDSKIVMTTLQTHASPDTTFKGVVLLDKDAVVRARILENPGEQGLANPESAINITFNKATAQKIQCDPLPHPSYAHGGSFTLVDGITAGDRRISTEWLGWLTSVNIDLDLGSVQSLSQLTLGAYHEPHSWIHRPEEIMVSVSLDGVTYREVGEAVHGENVDQTGKGGRIQYGIDPKQKARYVRFSVQNRGIIPEGFAGSGQSAWLFLDEIKVY